MKKENLKDKTENRKTIVIIFTHLYPMVGLKDITQRIDALNEKYNLIIVTNMSKGLEQKKNRKIIEIKKSHIFSNLSFLFKSRWKLFFEKYDAMFLTSISYSPIARIFKTKPIVCYGNVNPLQITGMKSYGRSSQENFFSYIKKYFRLKYLYFCLKNCDHVLSISKQLAQEYKTNGIQKKKIDLIYMGVDNDIFSRSEKSEKKNDKFTIVYPGTISEERGLSTILNGLKILSGRITDFQFQFIGCDELTRRRIMSKAKKLDIIKYVQCLPILDIKKTSKFVSEANVGISILENNEYFRTSPPTKVFEYMASGIPTVANRIETHTDYIKEGFNGLIIKSTPEEFSDAILRLHDNRALQKKMSDNAYESSKKYFWSTQKRAFLNVFHSILKN